MAWTLRHGRGEKSAFHWRLVMVACIAVLMVRLVSSLVHICTLIALFTPITLFSHPVLLVFSVVFYSGYGFLLMRYGKQKCFFDRLGLALSHPFYWAMTAIPQAYALYRMATGKLDWLKSPHQTYHAPSNQTQMTAPENATPRHASVKASVKASARASAKAEGSRHA